MTRQPKYVVVKEALRKRVASLEGGTRIPSTIQLHQEFEVSAQTVNRALQDLVEEGILERRHRSGTFVVQQEFDSLQIGMVWPETAQRFAQFDVTSSFILTFQAAAHAHNIVLKVAGNARASQPPFLGENDRVDGVLIFLNSDRELAQAYKTRGIPVLLVEPFVRSEDSRYVAFDHYMVPHVALQHLASLGHKHIVHLNVKTPPCLSNDLRRAGYHAAMEELGLAKYEATFDLPIKDWTEDDTTQLLHFITEKKATACYCINDSQAAGVMQVFRRAGIRVPEDISLIGLEDGGMAKDLSPALTAVRSWNKKSIEWLFEILDELLLNDSVPTIGHLFPVSLVERASTAQPASNPAQ